MSDRSARFTTPAIAVAVAVLVLAVYARSAGNGFVGLDDDRYIYANPHVTSGLTWEGLRWAFTTSEQGNWHPLTWISHMLDVRMFGVSPGAHHLVGAAIHALTSALLFLFFASTTGAVWPSALLAGLFGLHPLRVESVAWASERKDLLAGLFFVLTLLAYAAYARKPGAIRYLRVASLFVLGLLAKPMLVTLPLLLLLLDVWPLRRWPGPSSDRRTAGLRRLVLEKAPLLVFSAASSLVTAIAQRRGGAMSTLETIPAPTRIANALVSYIAYLAKTAWPSDLALVVPHPALVSPGGGRALAVPALAAAAALAGISFLATRAWPRRPYLAVGWFWYLGTLVPVIGLVQVGIQARADRYTYIPLIGIYAMIAWEAAGLTARWPRRKGLVVAGAAAWLALLAVATWAQVGLWRDSETLFRHALAITSRNYLIHTNLGSALEQEGRLREAREQYDLALAVKPDYSLARYNLGTLLRREGDLAGARAQYERVLDVQPGHLEARSNLAAVLAAMGDRAGAAKQLETVSRQDPEFAPGWYNLGVLRAEAGDLAAAQAAYQTAVRVDPGHAAAWNGLGAVLERQGKLDQAASSYAGAVAVRDGYFEAWFNLGAVSLKRRDVDRAAAAFDRAVRIRPDHAQAHYALAGALVRQRKLREAMIHYESAVRLDPTLTAAADDLRTLRRAVSP